MLDLVDVTLRLAGRPLLEGVSLHLSAGTRMALVGRNGSGKTSLLRLLAGELLPDAGTIRVRAGVRIGTVAQEAPGGAVCPRDAVLAADRERTALLAQRDTAEPGRLAEIEERLRAIGADAAPARAARILSGLGFDAVAQEQPLATFSGGWRMRVALAAVLFLEPDLLLLDEPTNHLDLEAAMWLEEHLRRYPRTLLLVSHDRDFLNSVPEKICHLEGRRLQVYAGGYDAFERQRAERAALMEKQRERQERERARIRAFVDRFRYKASKARQAQSRLKMLERMEPPAQAIVEPEVVFSFPVGSVPAPPLLTMDSVRVGYGERVVLDRLDLRIDPDDRIALLGANGNGKSTFAKLVAGRLAPLAGTLTRARGLTVGFFAQHQIEDLDPDATALEHLLSRLPGESEQRLRERLARFGLVQERATTRARHLSGGEKTRLCFCLMCLDPPHVLILDEPTNHLDIDSRAALIEAINEFEGAVIVVSHDRRLIELTADRLWLVADGRVRPFEGDVDDYRRLLLETSAGGAQTPPPAPKPSRVGSAERRSQLAPLRQRAREAERAVERLLAEREEVEGRLGDPRLYREGGPGIGDLQRRLVALEDEIAAAERLWLQAESAIEQIQAGMPVDR